MDLEDGYILLACNIVKIFYKTAYLVDEGERSVLNRKSGFEIMSDHCRYWSSSLLTNESFFFTGGHRIDMPFFVSGLRFRSGFSEKRLTR